MKKQEFDMAKAEARARDALNDAKGERTILLSAMHEGKDVTAQLNAIDAEITSWKQQLERYAEAKEVAARVATTTDRAAQHSEIVAKLDAGKRAATELGEQAQALIGLVESVGAHLTRIEHTRQTAVKALREATNAARPGAPYPRVVDDLYEQLHAAINELTLPLGLVRALWDAGVGRRGVIVSPAWLDITQVANRDDNQPHATPLAVVNVQLAKLAKLATQIEGWSTTLNVPTKEVA